jgi:gliding motility-associated-like protein
LLGLPASNIKSTMPKFFFIVILIFCSTIIVAQEICNNGIDDDGNGFADSLDATCNPCNNITQLNFEDGLLPSVHGWVSISGNSSIVATGSGNSMEVSFNDYYGWYYDLTGLCLDRCDWEFDIDFNFIFDNQGTTAGQGIGVEINGCASPCFLPQFGLHHYHFQNSSGVYSGSVDGVVSPFVFANSAGWHGIPNNALYIDYGNITHSGTVRMDNLSFFHCSTNCSCTPDTNHVTACDSAKVNGTWYHNSQMITEIFTSVHGCDSVVNIDLRIRPSVSANFTILNVCQDMPITVNGMVAIGSTGNIVDWLWDFGDGSPVSNIPDTTHQYVNGGVYTITLIVVSDSGCSDTTQHSVTIYNTPVAVFQNDLVCVGDSTHFINGSTINGSGGSTISSLNWTLGDGTTSGLQSPVHQYVTAGVYSTRLVATSNFGCSDTVQHNTIVHPKPNVHFITSNVCNGENVLFNNQSTIPTTDTIQSYRWNFGDGMINNNQNTSHLYSNPDSFNVQLVVRSNFGCSDSVSRSVNVNPNPQVNFSASDTTGCKQLCVTFQNTSTISTGNNALFVWSFGDTSTTSNFVSPTHCYYNNASPHSYTVSLTITSDSGCVSSQIKNNYITVYPNPTAQFTTANVCDGTHVPFTNLSTIPANATIQSYAWYFGDATPVDNSVSAAGGHLYTSPNTYNVTLVLISNSGCTDSVSQPVTVNPKPIANFTANDTAGCEPLCVSFQNVSSNNASSLWDLGDGSPASSSQDLFHCYTNDSVFSPNFFTVTLTATSDSGCVTTKTKNNYIAVYPSPNASFTVQPETAIITNPVISITDLSTGTNFWTWDFGDTITSIIASPAPHSYADTGTYQIILIASTQYNCKDTAYQTITIEPDFMFFIPNAFTPDGDGVNDTFTGQGIFIKTFKMSIFDRWGNLIYQTDDINKPWDGKANHGTEIAEQDVYVYVVTILDYKNRKHNYRGIVTLVR